MTVGFVPTPIERALASLTAHGLAVWDDLLSPEVASSIREEVLGFRARGLFKPAGIGKERLLRREIRGDSVCWILPPVDDDGDALLRASPGLTVLHEKLVEIARVLSEHALVNLSRIEMHAAHFGPGGRYLPHLDRSSGTSGRVFTYVYFLNPSWTRHHGGALRAITPRRKLMAPVMNRLVLFHTPEVLHEVMTTTVDRLAVTGWLGRG